MTADILEGIITDTRLEPFLPLLHAAWADGELTGDEIVGLCSRLSRLVDNDCATKLHGWLDPDSPPSPDDLARLASTIRGRTSDRLFNVGPTELGLRLAGSVPDSVVDALRTIDAEVGPFGPPATVGLIDRGDPSTLDPLPPPGTPPWDVAELAALVDGPHREVKARVRRILSRSDFAYRYDLNVAEYRERVLAWTKVLADERIGALGFPGSVGGAGDVGGFVAAFATVAQHDLSLLTKFGVQFGLFAGAVMRLGTERHHPLVAGALGLDPLGSFAMTEVGHGSNVADIETTATFLPGIQQWEINTPSAQAAKDYIGNAAAHGRMAVVFARLLVGDADHGVHAFVVPIRTEEGRPAPGVTIADDGPKAGLNGVDNGSLSFDRVVVESSALLDRFASVDPDGTYRSEITSPARRFFTTLGTLVGGRVSVASAAIAATEGALTIAVRYALRRRQFSTDGGRETRLIEYRTHQRRLMPRLATTYAYHFAAAALAEDYAALESQPGDTDVDRRAFEGRAAGLKAFATWHAMDTIQACREACGGQGYMAVNRLGRMRDDIDVFTTFEGDNTVLAQLLAKALLTDHRASFENMTPGRFVRYVADRVQEIVAESVPVVGSVGGDLTDPATLVTLLGRRSKLLTSKLALRVKARIDAGNTAADAFLDVQPHAVSAARAATELEVLEAVLAVETDDAGTRQVIERLGALFALSRVEVDLAWYMEVGLVTASRAKEIRATVTDLSAELAEVAHHLVNAFGIPDAILAAPIAL